LADYGMSRSDAELTGMNRGIKWKKEERDTILLFTLRNHQSIDGHNPCQPEIENTYSQEISLKKAELQAVIYGFECV